MAFLRKVAGTVMRPLAQRASFARMSARSVATEATIPVPDDSFKTHKLDSSPATELSVTRDEMLKTYTEMVTIRRMETTAGESYRAKKIRGFLHLYSGQEAICTGMVSAINPDVDSVVTAYRCHGWAYSLGTPVEAVLGELYGREIGCSNGKGGSMHMYSKRFFGGNGIVGAQVPVGAGIALAHQYKGDGGVCIALYGDGAANQGQVFEAYNIAQLWKLPTIFVCENNKYGMGTHDYRSSASTEYYTRGDYVPGLWINGMDFRAVKAGTEFAKKFAQEVGPIVIEMETYRYHGHSMSDPDTTYRTREDIKNVRQSNDPIINLKHVMIEHDLATEDELKDIEKQARATVKECSEIALASPEPNESEVVTHILAGEKMVNVRGCDNYTSYSMA